MCCFFLTRLALGLKCLSCFIAFDSCSQRARFQPLGWEPSDRWTQVNGIDSLKWPVTCVKVSGWKQRWYQIFQQQKTQWILVTLLGFHDLFYFKSEWQAKTYRKISCLSIKNKRPFNLMEILAVCFLHHNTTGSKVKIPTSLQKAGSIFCPQKKGLEPVISFSLFCLIFWHLLKESKSAAIPCQHCSPWCRGGMAQPHSHREHKKPCMVCLLPQGCSFESTSSCQ